MNTAFRFHLFHLMFRVSLKLLIMWLPLTCSLLKTLLKKLDLIKHSTRQQCTLIKKQQREAIKNIPNDVQARTEFACKMRVQKLMIKRAGALKKNNFDEINSTKGDNRSFTFVTSAAAGDVFHEILLSEAYSADHYSCRTIKGRNRSISADKKRFCLFSQKF